MRLLSALAVAATALLLSGCLAAKDKEAVDPLFGLCPQWSQGPGGQAVALHLTAENATSERELGPAEAVWQNHALDLFRVRITDADVADGANVQLRGFSADGKQLPMRDYRDADGPQMVPVVHIGAGDVGKEFDLFLSSIKHGSAAALTPAHLAWTLDGSDAVVGYDVTYHYKVCGADV